MAEFDKWGIPFWYPTKSTAGVTNDGHGFTWFQNNDIFKDHKSGFLRLGKEEEDTQVINLTTGEWEFPYLKDGDGLSVSGPTGHHSGGETHGCQGFAYMVDSNLDGSTPSFRFRKETYHVEYDDDPKTGEWTSPLATGPCKNVWKGIGWVRYNKKGGRSDGGDSVVLECWWNDNPTSDIKNWKMLKRTEDKGGYWGVREATCDGVAFQVGTWSNIQFRWKSSSSDFSFHPLIPEFEDGPVIHSIDKEDMSFSDSEERGYGKRADMPRDIEMKALFKWDGGGDGKCRFKNMSLREIDPTKSFDENPDQPTTGGPQETKTIQGKFKLLWDLNTNRLSACSGAGVTKFYEVPTDHEKIIGATEQTTKVAEQCMNSTSNFIGKKVKEMHVPMKKDGSPSASPTISAKIWNGAGTVVYTSPTTIDPTTLTNSYVDQIFDFSTNTRSTVTGDRIGIEYTGGTLNNYDNYVGCSYDDGVASGEDYAQFTNGSWSVKSERNFSCILWQ